MVATKKISKRQKETITVDIKRDIYQILERAAKDRNIPSLRQFVNYLLQSFLEKEKFLEYCFPGLSLYSVGKSSLFIKDYTDKKYGPHGTTVEISRKIINKEEERMKILHCSVDNSTICEHVQYALCLPEVVSLYEEYTILPIPVDLKANENKKISLKEFYAEKKPVNPFSKMLVFVYYITKFNRQPEVRYGEILSCYEELGEKDSISIGIPRMIKDSIKGLGWLEQGSDEFTTRLTPAGENFVEFKLPLSEQERKTTDDGVYEPLEDALLMIKKEQ